MWWLREDNRSSNGGQRDQDKPNKVGINDLAKIITTMRHLQQTEVSAMLAGNPVHFGRFPAASAGGPNDPRAVSQRGGRAHLQISPNSVRGAVAPIASEVPYLP